MADVNIKKYGCIYKLTNIINNKSYIGQSTKIEDVINRKYKGSGSVIALAIKKHKWSNFKTEILEYCSSIEELNIKEPFWIEKLSTLVPNGYNVKRGGEQGGKCSDELKLIISKSLKGKMAGDKNPMYGKESANKNKRFSLDHCSKISLSVTGDKNPMYGRSGENSPRFGKQNPCSEETRLKISKTIKGRKESQETKLKKSEALKGKIQLKTICPHCNKEGGISIMKYWHFDNCKRIYG